MTIEELALMLEKLQPRIAFVEGCFVLLSGLYKYEADEVRQVVASCGGDLREAEGILNRCFIVNDLLRFMDPGDWTSEKLRKMAAGLVKIATVFADLVRVELLRSFPDRSFDVLVQGSQLADNEPLELLVTFTRAS
jgi:hypothetical protein